jgi:ABC-type phosphate transport system permease subunit
MSLYQKLANIANKDITKTPQGHYFFSFLVFLFLMIPSYAVFVILIFISIQSIHTIYYPGTIIPLIWVCAICARVTFHAYGNFSCYKKLHFTYNNDMKNERYCKLDKKYMMRFDKFTMIFLLVGTALFLSYAGICFLLR